MAIATRSLAVHETQHANRCTVCKHPQRKEIEARFLRFGSRYALEREFGLPKDSLYRHAVFFRLYDKRDEKTALHTIIEHGMAAMVDRPPSSTNTIEAIKALAKLQGKWVDRSEDITVQLEKLTDEELDYYAKTGRIPEPGELDGTVLALEK